MHQRCIWYHQLHLNNFEDWNVLKIQNFNGLLKVMNRKLNRKLVVLCKIRFYLYLLNKFRVLLEIMLFFNFNNVFFGNLYFSLKYWFVILIDLVILWLKIRFFLVILYLKWPFCCFLNFVKYCAIFNLSYANENLMWIL